jgi:hypothetical protein
MYAAAGRDLSNESNEQKLAKHLQDFKAKLKNRLPDKTAFEAGFLQLRYSQFDSRDRPLIRYILGKIDAHLRKDATVDYSKMTIEHIAPQNPPGAAGAIPLFATIGNLVLVSEELNGKLKNKSFPEKKKIMLDVGLPLDGDVKSAGNWGQTEIEKRTKALALLLHTKDI